MRRRSRQRGGNEVAGTVSGADRAQAPWQAMRGALPRHLPAGGRRHAPRPAAATPGDVKAGVKQPDAVERRVKPDLSLVPIRHHGYDVALRVFPPRNVQPESM